ncbi:MAG: diguanylate cyclase [Verrucomicrobiae bacterium]|nr:diguanylate cyclase [Verrucomicrobiae bacterium]
MTSKPDIVLLVDDSQLILHPLSQAVQQRINVRVDLAHTFERAKSLLKDHSERILCVVTNLTLKDAPSGEVADYCGQHDVPTLVLTANYDDSVRQLVQQRKALGYIVKSPQCVDQIVQLIVQIHQRHGSKVLVVDDSVVNSKLQVMLLKMLKFEVLEANNGHEALFLLRENPNVILTLTDYEMPGMNGLELVSEIRKLRSKEEMAVIGVSATDNRALSAQFLKMGASDYIKKPFLDEEFQWRVLRNIEFVEQIQIIRDFSYRDYLTKLHNRRFFFDKVPPLFAEALSRKTPVGAAMLDIDHFKQINDTHGHDAGDAALRHVSALLAECFPPPTVTVRFGGEEFCVFQTETGAETMAGRLETFRRDLEKSLIHHHQKKLSCTISIGLSTQPQKTLDQLLRKADILLYQAKHEGRNRIAKD